MCGRGVCMARGFPWQGGMHGSGCINDYYYDIQLPINHVISKTVLHLVAVCITNQKHSKYMLKVCRKFSKKNYYLNFFS